MVQRYLLLQLGSMYEAQEGIVRGIAIDAPCASPGEPLPSVEDCALLPRQVVVEIPAHRQLSLNGEPKHAQA